MTQGNTHATPKHLRRDRFKESGKGQGSQGKVHGAFPELRALNFLEMYQSFIIPLRESYQQRKKELGLYYTDLGEWTKLNSATISRAIRGRDSHDETGTTLYTLYAISKALRLNMNIDLIDGDTGKSYATVKDPNNMALVENMLAKAGKTSLRLKVYYESTMLEDIESKVRRGIMLSPRECNELLLMLRASQGEENRLREWLSNLLGLNDAEEEIES